MTSFRVLVLLVLACGGSVPAWAQKITPGLWEHSVTMKTGSGRMEAGMGEGQSERMEMNHTARWLAADCGSVQPRGK